MSLKNLRMYRNAFSIRWKVYKLFGAFLYGQIILIIFGRYAILIKCSKHVHIFIIDTFVNFDFSKIRLPKIFKNNKNNLNRYFISLKIIYRKS